MRGLHVINPSDTVDEAAHQKMEQRFEQRLQEAGMSGKLLIISGDITTMVSEHSLLSDLLVLRLVFPPSGGILDRLTSGISNILRGARRPILIVKDQPQPLDRLLVVYNGFSQEQGSPFW